VLTCKQVVEKIKAVPDEARFLVVDPAADRYFADKGITISSELSCVEHITCPPTKPFTGLCWLLTLLPRYAIYMNFYRTSAWHSYAECSTVTAILFVCPAVCLSVCYSLRLRWNNIACLSSQIDLGEIRISSSPIWTPSTGVKLRFWLLSLVSETTLHTVFRKRHCFALL